MRDPVNPSVAAGGLVAAPASCVCLILLSKILAWSCHGLRQALVLECHDKEYI